MKILLVAINSQFSHSNLAVWYLKREAEENGAEVEIFESNVNVQYHTILFEILKKDFDAIGFSTYIFNRSVVEKLCVDIKKARPNTLVFVGGGEVYYHQNGMEKVADLVLLGEGESAVGKIARGEIGARLKNSEEQNIASESILQNGENKIAVGEVVLPESVAIRSLVESGYYQQENKILYYESSRGCPFSCAYCLSGAGNTLKTLPTSKVKEDIKALSEMGLQLIKFVDRTFNARADRGVEILEYIISLETKTCFHFEISPDLISDELVEVVKRSQEGQFQFEIGIQSFNEKTLSAVSRFTNVETLSQKISALIATGKANVHVDLIVGLPFEDFETFKTSFNLAYALQSAQLQVGFLKVLSGTQLQVDAEKHGIIYSAFPPYQIFQTAWLSQKDVLRLVEFEKSVEIFHNERKFEKSLQLLLGYFQSPFDMFMFLSSKLPMGNMSLQTKIEILYSTLLEYASEEVAEAVVRYDYFRVCKDKKIKYPLLNMPDELYQNRHKKDRRVQWFEIDPITLEKKRVKYEFKYDELSPVNGMFAVEKLSEIEN